MSGLSRDYVLRDGKRLRKGYTTGSCAAAAAAAAAQMLLAEYGEPLHEAAIVTPDGTALRLEIQDVRRDRDTVSCAVAKDGGDDPDITSGLLVYAKLSKRDADIVITGGQGVGRVTKKGLACPVGAAAINPVPMAMIQKELTLAANAYGYTGGFNVEISVPGGEKVACNTYNPHLGIVGGISILGTTGIVEPMSNKALVDTLRLEMDVLAAQGARTLLLVPGNYGRDFALDTYGVDIKKAVQCSNFIGEALDYAVYKGFSALVLMGHSGKLVKLAAGIMNTHSSMADARMEILTAHAALTGELTADRARELLGCVTVDAANALFDAWHVRQSVWDSVRDAVALHLRRRLGGKLPFAFVLFGADGILTQYGTPEKMLEEI